MLIYNFVRRSFFEFLLLPIVPCGNGPQITHYPRINLSFFAAVRTFINFSPDISVVWTNAKSRSDAEIWHFCFRNFLNQLLTCFFVDRLRKKSMKYSSSRIHGLDMFLMFQGIKNITCSINIELSGICEIWIFVCSRCYNPIVFLLVQPCQPV